MKITLIFVALLSLCAWARSETTGTRTHAEFSVESSQLSNHSPDWRAQSLRLSQSAGPREVKEVTLAHTNRFGLNDHQLSATYATALSDQLTASLGASISPSHRVLAKNGLDMALQYEFAPAWLAHAGLRTKRYSNTHVNQASLTLEHYFSAFSMSAAWRPVRALGVNASSVELRGAYYYGNANSVGFIVSSGQEATSVNANTVLLANVRSTALLGRHWLSPQWAINYAVARNRQGSFYNQSSVHLGAEYLF
jgi:YaiO family outer membrane protein